MDGHVRFAHPRPKQTTSVHGSVNVRADSGGVGTRSRADRPLESGLCFRPTRANSHVVNMHHYQVTQCELHCPARRFQSVPPGTVRT
jgi:hypothetical protein